MIANFTDVSPFPSRDEPYNLCDERRSLGFAGRSTIDTNGRLGDVFGEASASGSEGIFGGKLRGIASSRSRGQMRGIGPGQGGRHQAEIKMIADRIGALGLDRNAADLLFDLPESGLRLPPRGTTCLYLLDPDAEVRAHQGD